MAKSLPLNGQVDLSINIYVTSLKCLSPGLSDDRGDADHAGGGSAPAGQQGLPGAELRQGRGLHGVRVAADRLHIPGVHITTAGPELSTNLCEVFTVDLANQTAHPS